MSTNESGKSKYREGSLYKRGKAGNYYLRFYVNGKQTNQRLTDSDGNSISERRKAEKVARDLLAPLRHEGREDQQKAIAAKVQNEHEKRIQAIAAQKPAFALSTVWKEYQASGNRPRSGESTLKRYELVITKFNEWLKEQHPDIINMQDVTLEHAEGYATHLEDNKLSPSSFNIYLNALGVVWATLWVKANIQNNPFAWDKKSRTGIQRKNIKAETTVRKKRPLTLEEVNKVIEKAEGDYRLLLIILACTGQRLVDGLKLQWKEIDLQQGVIALIPRKTAGRTGKTVYIPILPQLRLELESLLHNGRYVLPELVKDYDRDPSIISKKIRSIFNAAELTAHKDTDLQTSKAIVETGAHSLRHSFVTIARLAGVPDAVIMQITGHQSSEMIDHYTTFDKEQVAKLAAQVGAKSLPASKQNEPVPEWVLEKLKGMTTKNWKKIQTEVLSSANKK